MKIAIDAMGGDKGLPVVIPAIKQFLDEHDTVSLILVGVKDQITDMLYTHNIVSDRISIVHASEVVAMDEPPSQALRYKKDSSIRVGVNLVKSQNAQAFVSAGNTGALMAISKFVLKTIPGISRPAIVSAMPSINGYSYLLDLGANIDCSATHLYQFAIMGAILKSSLNNNMKPRVALLNIGQEEIKGTETIREASRMLSSNDFINYVGYLEGNDIYKDIADVIVCDGFVGNVALKTSEGLSQFIMEIFKQAYTSTWYTKLVGFLTIPIVKKIKKQLDPKNYNGASLLGLNGIVVKSHGGADSSAFANAIVQAKCEIENNVLQHLNKNIKMLSDTGRF